jgi:hypothetical protein
MDDTLARLLEAEARAQAILDAAAAERQRILDTAQAQIHDAETRFAANRASLREPILRDAEARAAQAIAELTRKHAERQRHLRALAERHEAAAVEAVLGVLLDPAA